MSPIPIGRKVWFERIVDAVITELMGWKILVEVGAILPEIWQGHASVTEPSGLQQGHHVTMLAPVVVENLVSGWQNFLSKRDL